MAIKAILFDLDGTLVDSNALHVTAWDRAFRKHGYTLDGQAIHDQLGKGADNLVPALLGDVEGQTSDALDGDHGQVFKSEYLSQVRPFTGAHELLQRIHDAGQKIVFASSASQSELDHYLELLEARPLVTATTSADEVSASKPAPDIFAAALAKLTPLGADEVLAVGDTPYDVQSAKGSGIATVAVRSGGFADQALLDAGAIAIYDDVAALLRDYDASPLAR